MWWEICFIKHSEKEKDVLTMISLNFLNEALKLLLYLESVSHKFLIKFSTMGWDGFTHKAFCYIIKISIWMNGKEIC